MAKNKKLKLKVLFDTNVIYTATASDLLRQEINDLISAHSNLSDIEITWHLPDVVVKERIYQMIKKGNELLTPIQKMERLLGHNLNITADIVANRVKENVNQQIKTKSIDVVNIDTAKVDWQKLIDNAISRQAPFEEGEKEKGFRDALIYECLCQLIAASPTTRTLCRIVLVSGDNLLNTVSSELMDQHANVHVFLKIEELTSLINVLNSEITEEQVNRVIGQAEKLFFEKGDKATLYFSAKVRDTITDKFPTELNQLIENSNTRENETWWINKPGFERKDKQKIYWKTVVEVEFNCYNVTYNTASEPPALLRTSELGKYQSIPALGKEFNSYDNWIESVYGITKNRPRIPGVSTNKSKVGNGRTKFEVIWSTTITTAQKLTTPRIESVSYLETIQL